MCRHCGSKDHLFIHCPFRSPDLKPKPWKEQVEAFDTAQEKKSYKCDIKLHPGKSSRVCSDGIDEFWADIRVHFNQSIYRDFAGIQVKGTGMLIPPDQAFIEPGDYILVSRTHSMRDEEIHEVLQEGVDKLRRVRPLSLGAVADVEENLLLRYNHFSLSHEGSSLGLDETRLLTNILADKDWKHTNEDEDLESETNAISESKHDLQEAINHILVSRQLSEYANADLTEDQVLRLHSLIMHDLLHIEEEGLPGEYRKVAIGVEGSSIPRSNHADVPPLMSRWFKESLVQCKDEAFIDFLARIHTQFQLIHPFRDGNGRIGRLVMNILLVKRGYPVLVFPTTLSAMFNHGVDIAHHGDTSFFSRLIAEALFSSLQAYEDAIGEQLLPSIEEIVGKENLVGRPTMVSP